MPPSSSFTPWFPEPGSYIRYYDTVSKNYKYRRLMERRMPLKYPIRIPQVTAGNKSSDTIFEELNPSDSKRHIYMAYLGLKPGFTYELFHPYDVKILKWDEQIRDISEDDTANLTYEDSPYEKPVKAIWIEHDRYPMLRARNILGRTVVPEVIWIAALYVIKEHSELSADEIDGLRSGRVPSIPADFGGEL